MRTDATSNGQRRLLFSGTSRSGPETQAHLNQERLWALLEQGAVTLRELHDQGVKFPAQEMYELQVAGYAIDRLRLIDASGQPTLGYRLGAQPQAVFDHGVARATKPVGHRVRMDQPCAADCAGDLVPA
jgi:hypothetical protein